MRRARNLLAGAAVLALAAAAGSAFAHHVGETWSVGKLTLSHGWTYEISDASHGMPVYLTIDNGGDETDRLIAASVPFAERTVLQAQTLDEDGTLEVEDVEAIAIAPGQVLTLQPAAAWIELESVQESFEHGQHFDLELTFERAGTVTIEVEVEEPDAHEHEDEPAT